MHMRVSKHLSILKPTYQFFKLGNAGVLYIICNMSVSVCIYIMPAELHIYLYMQIYMFVFIIIVTIESTDGEPWMGFILQARRVMYGLDQTQNIGSFVTNPSSTTQTCASYGVRICKVCKLNILKRDQACTCTMHEYAFAHHAHAAHTHTHAHIT